MPWVCLAIGTGIAAFFSRKGGKGFRNRKLVRECGNAILAILLIAATFMVTIAPLGFAFGLCVAMLIMPSVIVLAFSKHLDNAYKKTNPGEKNHLHKWER